MSSTHSTEVSRHKCLIYDGHPSEQLPVIVPLLLDGLSKNERCLYLGEPATIGMVRDALATRGVNVPQQVARGALVFSSERDAGDAPFDPQAMVGMLTDLIDGAVRDGFDGLCATGDMRWELGGDQNFERLLEYEALLERLFCQKPLRGICQYHRGSVPNQAIQDALVTHRSLYIGASLNRDNLFYIPPDLLLRDREQGHGLGEWMCQQLTRMMDAESVRDRALDALRASDAQQRRLAKELAQINRDLEQRVEARTAALEAANRDLEAFSYSVSHDLRAPVRHIDGFAQLLENDHAANLGAVGLSHVAKIRAAAANMNALISGMLTLAQVARTELSMRAIDLSALASASAEELRRMASGRHVDVVIEPDLRARGDETLLRAVMENLLGNAWKFTSQREHARIEVRGTGAVNGYKTFEVADNGAGFDMQYAQKLFGVFQRLHPQRDFQGTGIGLATVERIVRRHGGRVWAKAAPNAGATFYFTLPSTDDEPPD